MLKRLTEKNRLLYWWLLIGVTYGLMGLVLLFSCKQKESKTEMNVSGSVKTEATQNSSALAEKEKRTARDYQMDSLRLDSVLNDALKIAQQNIESENYAKTYDVQPGGEFDVQVNIVINHLFSEKQIHLLIRRTTAWATYLNLYKITGTDLTPVVFREQGPMSYIRDTAWDANGDGRKDFLVHWYPPSGCCIRNIYNVYLNKGDGTFTSDYKFINPTFYPSEKIIRGVEYGHPGEVGLYKYKWNGLKVDTIEFIYHDRNNDGQFIKTKKEFYGPTEKDGVILKAVPKEYHNIESYDWFLGS